MSQWFAAALGLGLMASGALAAPASVPTSVPTPAPSWVSDNGNGTYTNPLFNEEFSDPDMIRVGNDFYLTGTTMHAMPGLPVLHSKDLVNWDLVGYALDKLDLGPAYRLENGQTIYGRGIWAPSFRYHDGTFYIFSNVNGATTQMFRAKDPKGPWTRTAMKRSFHDLSVLFDDDGKVYVVWGYRNIHIAQLDDDLTDMVPGTEHELFSPDSLMGEGSHFYKIDGKYFITSAWYMDHMRLAAARADRPYGPYEVLPAISIDEDFGQQEGYHISRKQMPFDIVPPNPNSTGRLSSHQGGLVQTPAGQWWGFSMYEGNSLGRLTMLSPVTWKDGWPYFGLPGNLTRTPRIWVKPDTGASDTPHAPYRRNDDFSGALANVWQWNHVPDDKAWSLSERPGYLRLHTRPAVDFWNARNSLTQRALGPVSAPTAVLDAGGLARGDVAGLALLNMPYAWIGVERGDDGLSIVWHESYKGKTVRAPLTAAKVWLRADCDFVKEKARFSYSEDGKTFKPLGDEFTTIYQLVTFQGVRYALFAYNARGADGGYADFDAFTVEDVYPRGLRQPIPYGRRIRLAAVGGKGLHLGEAVSAGAPTSLQVLDMGLGRVALKAGPAVLSVAADGGAAPTKAKPGLAETFQWMETPTGEILLMSLQTNRYLRIDPASGTVRADSPGPLPSGKDGVRLAWEPAPE